MSSTWSETELRIIQDAAKGKYPLTRDEYETLQKLLPDRTLNAIRNKVRQQSKTQEQKREKKEMEEEFMLPFPPGLHPLPTEDAWQRVQIDLENAQAAAKYWQNRTNTNDHLFISALIAVHIDAGFVADVYKERHKMIQVEEQNQGIPLSALKETLINDLLRNLADVIRQQKTQHQEQAQKMAVQCFRLQGMLQGMALQKATRKQASSSSNPIIVSLE